MGLLELRDYLKGRGEVSTRQLAEHFAVEASAIEQMAQEWLRRGKLTMTPGSCSRGGSCGGCCASPLGNLYRWLD